MESLEQAFKRLGSKGLHAHVSMHPKNGFSAMVYNNSPPFKMGRCQNALTPLGALLKAEIDYEDDSKKWANRNNKNLKTEQVETKAVSPAMAP